mmetsp:Transcript_26950/g.75693  ORF Transcript_26950/g.75693 Transcript_26950/m.75693 type:complete len:131 (+) Transcript_26950:24-416(+)
MVAARLLFLPALCAALSTPPTGRGSPSAPLLSKATLPAQLPALPARLSAALLSAAATSASAAPERGAIENQLDDRLVVGFALVVLVATALLNLSLGDVVADEANLPSSSARINDLRQKRSDFLRSRNPPQ